MARGLTGLCREGEGNMTEKAVGRGGARRARIPEERSLAAPPVLCGMVNECVDVHSFRFLSCSLVTGVTKSRTRPVTNTLVTQSCLTLVIPMDCSLPGSSVMGFPRQEHCSGLPFPSPRDLPNPGIEPASPLLAGRFFITEPPVKPNYLSTYYITINYKFGRAPRSLHMVIAAMKLKDACFLEEK